MVILSLLLDGPQERDRRPTNHRNPTPRPTAEPEPPPETVTPVPPEQFVERGLELVGKKDPLGLFYLERAGRADLLAREVPGFPRLLASYPEAAPPRSLGGGWLRSPPVYSSDGAWACLDSTGTLLDLSTGATTKLGIPVAAAAFLPGNRLATVGGSLRLWDLKTGQLLLEHELSGPLDWVGAGSKYLALKQGQTFSFVRLRDGLGEGEVLEDVLNHRCHDDRLLVYRKGKAIELWDLGTRHKLWTRDCPEKLLMVGLDAESLHAAKVAPWPMLEIDDLVSGEVLFKPTSPHPYAPRAKRVESRITDDGHWFHWSFSPGKEIDRWWHLPTARLLPEQEVLATDADGRWAVLRGEGDTLQVYDSQQAAGPEAPPMRKLQETCDRAELGANGLLLLQRGQRLTVVRVDTGQRVVSWSGPADWAHLPPHSSRLLLSAGGALRVWDLEPGPGSQKSPTERLGLQADEQLTEVHF